MHRRRTSLAAGIVLAAMVLLAGLAGASTPPASTVTVPGSAGQTASSSWTGTIPPGANPTSACNGLPAAPEDSHTVNVNVAPGTYTTVSAKFTFSISWTPSSPNGQTSDEILSVYGPDGSEIGSSDGSGTTEQVTAFDLPAGPYRVVACGFSNALPQPYDGKLEITTSPAGNDGGETTVPSAPANGLAFSAAVPSDNQRDESEPLIEISKDGLIYTCGPTGFSGASDYAQVSTDDGDQFHLLGTPPRGQQGSGGGGDCGLATGTAKNEQGKYQYTYSGLGPLTGFTSSTSPNDGRSIATGGPQAAGATQQGGGADRQWNVSVGAKTVLISYNQQAPRNVVVQRSTDGGLTYSPLAPIAAPNPTFPGPMRYDERNDVVFFGWDKDNRINLSISRDKGATWTACNAAIAPSTTAGFVVADADSAGNIYIAYTEDARYHTYMVVLKAADVARCNEPTTAQPATNPGFSAPVQVDRDAVRTTVFPWLVAGGEPGRVAVTFYGTETDGNPNTGAFKASWDVYVNQTVNALDAGRTFSQVKATTHPSHYDSICLNGLGCDIAVPPGDRSLADFFAIDYSPTSKRLHVTFNRAEKKPDEASGHVASPMVVSQVGGPSLGGGSVSRPDRVALRSSSPDQTGDALSAYSVTAPAVVPPAPPTKNEPPADLVSASIGPEVDLVSGAAVPNGGFTLTFKVADLSTAALQQSLTSTGSGSLLWVFRFANGYQAAAASARWNPVTGFTFGYNDYTTGSVQCGSSGEKCLQYPGDTPVQGAADQATGTIRVNVPRFLLRALSGGTGPGQRPTETPATVGSRFYDAAIFSLGNVSPLQNVQSFLYPLDNTPAMDFLLPAPGSGTGGGGGGTGTPCKLTGGGSIGSGSNEGKFSLSVHAAGKGNVQYRDIQAGVDFRSTRIDSITCLADGKTARVQGQGRNDMDGSTVTFGLEAVDNGEPGSSDSLTITIGGSYRKTGTLTKGNLQVR